MQEFESARKHEHIKLQQQAAALQSKEEELLRLQALLAHASVVLMACIYRLFFRPMNTCGLFVHACIIRTCVSS